MRHIRACPVPAAVPRACAMPGRAGPCRRVRRPAGQGACRMRRWRPRTAYRPTRLALQLAPLAPISQYLPSAASSVAVLNAPYGEAAILSALQLLGRGLRPSEQRPAPARCASRGLLWKQHFLYLYLPRRRRRRRHRRWRRRRQWRRWRGSSCGHTRRSSRACTCYRPLCARRGVGTCRPPLWRCSRVIYLRSLQVASIDRASCEQVDELVS